MNEEPLRRPGMALIMTFNAPIRRIELDQSNNTILVITDEGVHRIKTPERSPT